MFKKYLRYPFELQNLFRAMSFLQFLKSSVSFLLIKFFKTEITTNFIQTMVHEIIMA